MHHIQIRPLLGTLSAIAIVCGCAGGGTSADEARSNPQAAATISDVPPVGIPHYSETKSCVYEKTINGKKFLEERSLAKAADDHVVWNVKKDGVLRGVFELDARTAEVVRDFALSNDQRISFSPPYKWADFPIAVGKTWESKSTITGETFTADVTTRFTATSAERVKVPAGEFDAIKVEGKESIRSGNTSGTGTLTYWISASNKCVVKVSYSNTYREKGQALLVASE